MRRREVAAAREPSRAHTAASAACSGSAHAPASFDFKDFDIVIITYLKEFVKPKQKAEIRWQKSERMPTFGSITSKRFYPAFSQKAGEVNASWFCYCSTALGGNDCLGCLADKTPRASVEQPSSRPQSRNTPTRQRAQDREEQSDHPRAKPPLRRVRCATGTKVRVRSCSAVAFS